MKKKSLITALLSALVLVGCTSTASQVSTEYYTVRGTTAQQIDNYISRNGPMEGHALATAAIQFEPVTVQQEVTANSCHVRRAQFRVIANITLPRWADRAASNDRQLRSAWSNLSRYAKLHEDMHVRIAESYAREMGRALEALPPRATCDQFDRDAKRVLSVIRREHHRAQLAFDAAEQRRLQALFAQRRNG